MKTVVLRFSNQEANTIDEHRVLLAASPNGIWWGWWRKDFESERGEVLRRLRSRLRQGSVRVALINRKDDTFHAATCDGIEFPDDTSQRLPAPDAAQVPDYYSDAECAAWFHLTAIEPMSQKTHELEFGPVPIGDSTLYEVRTKAEGGLEVVPKPSWSMDATETYGRTILHLSDLHFGDSHGFSVAKQALPGRGVQLPNLAQHILPRLNELSHNIGVVVVSGDLITKGAGDSFNQVEDFLRELGEGLGLEPRHMVITPGNHDFTVIKMDEKPTLDYGHERAFRRFLTNFYGLPHMELERIQRFRTTDGWDYVFIALNSARLRGDDVREYGYIGRHRYEEMLRYAKSRLGVLTDISQKRLALAVFHHHVLPVQPLSPPVTGRPISVTVDAAEVCQVMQAHGVRMLLHGHQHLPFLGTHRRADAEWRLPPRNAEMYVIGNGSSGSKVEDLCPEMPYNTFGLYEPSSSGLRLSLEKFLPGVRASTVVDQMVGW